MRPQKNNLNLILTLNGQELINRIEALSQEDLCEYLKLIGVKDARDQRLYTRVILWFLRHIHTLVSIHKIKRLDQILHEDFVQYINGLMNSTYLPDELYRYKDLYFMTDGIRN